MLDWVLNSDESQPPANWSAEEPEVQLLEGFESEWAVLQCVDSLVWCVRDGDAWIWACQEDPAVRAPRAEMLMEARLFGPSGEVMLWPAGDGSFAGRWLKAPPSCNGDPDLSSGTPDLRPLKELAPFEEAEVTSLDEHFEHRRVNNGRITVTPKGIGVEAIQHLQEDACGIVRVAITQFLGIVPSEKGKGG
jgi:hypothetical protein